MLSIRLAWSITRDVWQDVLNAHRLFPCRLPRHDEGPRYISVLDKAFPVWPVHHSVKERNCEHSGPRQHTSLFTKQGDTMYQSFNFRMLTCLSCRRTAERWSLPGGNAATKIESKKVDSR